MIVLLSFLNIYWALLDTSEPLAIYRISGRVFMIAYLCDGGVPSNAMSFACTTCDAEFESAAAVTQHMPLHHDVCAVCNETFDDSASLRDHVHQAH